MRVRELITSRVVSEKIILRGNESTGVTVLMEDADGKALLATGTTVPSDDDTLYAKGCMFIDTGVATGTSGLYVNVGTKSACVFKLVTNAA